MIHDPRYAYLVASSMYLCVWAVLFFLRKDQRRQMIHLSLLTTALALTEPIFRRDYWHPTLFSGWPIGPEDIMFCFAIGGIAAVIYELVFNKKYSRRKVKKIHPSVVGIAVGAIVWTIFGILLLHLNSVYV